MLNTVSWSKMLLGSEGALDLEKREGVVIRCCEALIDVVHVFILQSSP